MTELQRALDDISNIRSQIAEVQLFQGFGPLVIALTGVLALGLATLQTLTGGDTSLLPWIALACLSTALIAIETYALTRRTHGPNASNLLWAILQKFLPCLIAGAALGWIILTQTPGITWILPGLWQILLALGLFAATSMLPRNTLFAAGWYLVAGLLVLMISAQATAITPWAMGLPFGLGQILLACLLHWAPEKRKDTRKGDPRHD
jgi:branched-subunit amino acid permease